MVWRKAICNIVLASEDLCALRALRDTIEPCGDLHITGEATAIAAISGLVNNLQPDVLVVDVAEFDELLFNAIQQTRLLLNPPGILVISPLGEINTVGRVLDAGVLGYFLSRDDPELIPIAIRAVTVGLPCTSPTLRKRLLDLVLKTTRVEADEIAFTPQEQHVLHLFAKGFGVLQTARSLGVVERTVRHHMDNIPTKTGLNSREEIIVYAAKNGFDQIATGQ